eukprot:NODE_496_length_6811_cov_0.672378.p4 type:complete len:323 gc:universal NODE_496_length_6811_cov_0.672378:4261-3293(-)
MVEAFLLRANSKNTYQGGVDEPKDIKIKDVKCKEVVFITEPLNEQVAIDHVDEISKSTKCSKIGILLSPVSSLYAVNETTGIVLDLNESGMYFSAIFEGKYLPYCSLRYFYNTDYLFRAFKENLLPKIKSEKSLERLSDEKQRKVFDFLLKESIPNDERECCFVSIEHGSYTTWIKLSESESFEITIPATARTQLLDDLLKNHDFFLLFHFILLKIPNRIRNILASKILLTGPFSITDFDATLRTGVLKYLSTSDQINENQVASLGFINRLAIDHLELAREKGLLWFAGGQLSRKYLMQDEKYYMSENDFSESATIINKLCN